MTVHNPTANPGLRRIRAVFACSAPTSSVPRLESRTAYIYSMRYCILCSLAHHELSFWREVEWMGLLSTPDKSPLDPLPRHNDSRARASQHSVECAYSIRMLALMPALPSCLLLRQKQNKILNRLNPGLARVNAQSFSLSSQEHAGALRRRSK